MHKCSEKCRNIQRKSDPISRKKKKLKSDINTPVPNIGIISSQPDINFSHQDNFFDFMNFELDDNSFKDYEKLQDNQYNDNNNNVNEIDNIDGLLYGLDEVQELITKLFQDAEDSNEQQS